jgi:hypothetical protein
MGSLLKKKICSFGLFSFVIIAVFLVFTGAYHGFGFVFQKSLGLPDYEEIYALRGSINLISFIPVARNEKFLPEGQIFIMDPAKSAMRYFRDSFENRKTTIHFDSQARLANDGGMVWKINREFKSRPARFGGRYEEAGIRVIDDKIFISWAYRQVPEMELTMVIASAAVAGWFLYRLFGWAVRRKEPG